MVALIPARAGSKRCPGKNTRLLGGHPLIAWTIHAAKHSDSFSQIYVCSDDAATYMPAQEQGVIWWPRHDVADDQPDVMWVSEFFRLTPRDNWPECFAILRPTSPFRTSETIRRAYAQFTRSEVHSLRAVEPVKQHPGKMWQCFGAGYPMTPLIQDWPANMPGGMPEKPGSVPWHSRPTQTLPKVYIQNASLEMAWSFVIPAFGTISGKKIAPFFTEGYEGFDINTEEDWREAERLVASGAVAIPALATPTP